MLEWSHHEKPRMLLYATIHFVKSTVTIVGRHYNMTIWLNGHFLPYTSFWCLKQRSTCVDNKPNLIMFSPESVSPLAHYKNCCSTSVYMWLEVWEYVYACECVLVIVCACVSANFCLCMILSLFVSFYKYLIVSF